MKLSICLLLIFIHKQDAQRGSLWGQLWHEDLKSAEHLLNITAEIIKDTDRRIGILLTIKKLSSENAAFEVGYLTYNIQDKYRRMVDKYNTSISMRTRLYLMEHILYLEEIERQYWEIMHIANMMHEIERKYKIKSDLFEEYAEETPPDDVHGTGTELPDELKPTKKRKEKKRTPFKLDRYLVSSLTSTRKRRVKKWPIEYGWEVDYPEVGVYNIKY